MRSLLPLLLLAACAGPPERAAEAPACLGEIDAAALDATDADASTASGSLVFVLDHSSSMDETYADGTRAVDAMHAAVSSSAQANPKLLLGAVAFRHEVYAEVRLAEDNAAALDAAMQTWTPGGRACLAEPLDRAVFLLSQGASPRHILVVLDDAPTECGGSEAAGASAAAAAAQGITIHAVRVDTDRPDEGATEAFLRGIADDYAAAETPTALGAAIEAVTTGID